MQIILTQVLPLQAPTETPVLPSLTTSFDIGLKLKDSERLGSIFFLRWLIINFRAAKQSLQLPYTRMQNEQGLFCFYFLYCSFMALGMVDIRMSSNKKVRVGGQVIYTPDDGDDLDDSDPDDDLNL